MCHKPAVRHKVQFWQGYVSLKGGTSGKHEHLYWRGRSVFMFCPHIFIFYRNNVHFCWRNSDFDLYQHEMEVQFLCRVKYILEIGTSKTTVFCPEIRCWCKLCEDSAMYSFTAFLIENRHFHSHHLNLLICNSVFVS